LQTATRSIGVDPGVSGAIAILEGDRLIHVFDMPVIETLSGKKKKRRISPEILVAELRQYVDGVKTVYIEDVHAMPGQGVTSMFSFGEAAGLVRGVMAGLGLPVQMVSPTHWKRGLRLPQGKDASRAMAARLWPLEAAYFRRVRDDGRAEAALIALWGMTSARSGG